ncbi:unnamed protein product [Allacma fusca]|uniref:Uncharacterized protein n=1 Tax=Allacma fusca TaxID=39272 RepID=A0A8J2KQ95_9HEXA|nr:unnamed protein product [Allacma fusca]
MHGVEHLGLELEASGEALFCLTASSVRQGCMEDLKLLERSGSEYCKQTDKMIPILWAVLRNYAPVIVFPAVVVVGVIGYNIEGIVSNKYTPFKPSIEEQRSQRQLEELGKLSSEPTNCRNECFFVFSTAYYLEFSNGMASQQKR